MLRKDTKIEIPQKFLLGLLAYMHQIEASICRRESNEWDEFTMFFKERVMPMEVWAYLNKLDTSFDKTIIPESIIAYIELGLYPYSIQVLGEKIKATQFTSLEVSILHKFYYNLLNLVSSKEKFLTVADITTIKYLLLKFNEIITMEQEPPLYSYTGLRVPFLIYFQYLQDKKLNDREKEKIWFVERFNGNICFDYFTIEKIAGKDWLL